MPTLPSVTHSALYSGVVQEVNTAGYACFLLKGAQCFSRMITPQKSSSHTQRSAHNCSNHSTECSLSVVKIAFPFFWPILKTKAKSFKEQEENTEQKPQCGYRSTISVLQNGTVILVDDAGPSLALHCDHQVSGVTHRAATKTNLTPSLCQLQNRASPKPAGRKA